MHYKLRLVGVLIDGSANVFCDNCRVVKNASIPELSLMKKHNAINYHAVRLRSSGSRYFESWKGGWQNKQIWTAKGSHQWLMLSGEPPGRPSNLLIPIRFYYPRRSKQETHGWNGISGLMD